MRTDGSNAKAQQNTNQQTTLKDWLSTKVMTKQIAMALPRNITPERMMRIAMTALTRNEKLAQTTSESFMGALLTSAQLGLECNTPLGQAYLIPYWNEKAGLLETQFQIGYQGLLDLCYRTNMYKTIHAQIVYEGDEFREHQGFDAELFHRPLYKSKDPLYAYAYYELVNGGRDYDVMPWDDIMEFAKKKSQSVKTGKKSPWDTDPEAMAEKTVLKRLLKKAPKTVEAAKDLANAISNDSTVLSANVVNDSSEMFIDVVATHLDDETTTAKQIEPPKQPQARAAVPQRGAAKSLAEQAAGNNAGLSPEEEAAMNAAFDAQAERWEYAEDPADIF